MEFVWQKIRTKSTPKFVRFSEHFQNLLGGVMSKPEGLHDYHSSDEEGDEGRDITQEELDGIPGQHTVNFSNANLSEEGIERLFQKIAAEGGALRNLYLGGNPNIDLEMVAEQLGDQIGGVGLERLALDNCGIGGEEIGEVIHGLFESNPNLNMLLLRNNIISNTGAQEIQNALVNHLNLLQIRLEGNQDEDDPIERATLDAIEALLQRNRDLHEQQQAEQKNKNDQQGPGGGAGGDGGKDDKGGKRKRDGDDKDNNNPEKRARTDETTPSSSTQGSSTVLNLAQSCAKEGVKR
jgi:hypothetical protein